MPISIQCTKCGRSFKVRDELAGKRVKCPCGEAFAVPAQASVADLLEEEFAIQNEPPVAAAKSPAPPRSQPQPSAAAPAGVLLRPKRKRRTALGRNAKLAIGISIAAAGVVAVIALALVFWGGGPGAMTTEFYATLEEAFAAHKAATLAKDWKGVLAALTPESQDQMVAIAAMLAANVAPTDQEMARLLDDYHVSPADVQPISLQPRGGDLKEAIRQMEERQKRLLNSIHDKPAFYAAVMDRLDKRGGELAEKLGSTQSDISKAQAQATLRDVKIDGDTAQGKQSVSFLGRTIDVPVEFRRVEGGWLVHLPGADAGLSGADRAPAPTTAKEEAAVAGLQKLGAKVDRDRSGRPNFVGFPRSGADPEPGLALLKDLPTVQLVFLDRTAITDAKLEHLRQLPSLERLRLDQTRISDAGLSHLKVVTSLREVHLESTQVTGTGFRDWSQLTGLQDLYLSGTPFSDEGMSHIGRMSSLRVLYIDGTRVTDSGVAHLKALNNLETLYLSDTKVTDSGLEHLKDLTNLRLLAMHRMGITDAGMASIKRLTNLRRLILDGTRVTDAGLEYVRGFTALNVLELRNTPVTEAGVKRIQEALPRCKIRR